MSATADAAGPSAGAGMLRPISPELDVLSFEPETIIVVSDLHLAAGRDAVTGRYSAQENFFADDTFRSFLTKHGAEGSSAPVLVFCGDTFDFLRITETPRGEEDLLGWSWMLAELGVSRDTAELGVIRKKEREYGFGTEDYKCVWKLLYIARGHSDFFAAIGEWVSKGGLVVFVKGNHDVELFWPLMQKAIRRTIALAHPGAAVEERVLFVQAGLRIGNVYLEHGHRFESITRVFGDPLMQGGHVLNLPLGSFVNRYIINRLESVSPFLDNQKPVQDVLWSVVQRFPWTIARILWNAVPLLRRSLRPHWWRQSFAFMLFALTILLPVLGLALVVIGFVPALRDWIPDFLARWRYQLSLVGVVTPYVVGFIRELQSRRKRRVGEDEFAEGMHEALAGVDFGKKMKVLYGVMGHTHRADIQRLPQTHGAEALYLNTGTWIPRWEKGRPDLVGRVLLSFIRFNMDVTGEYKHEHLEWNRETEAERTAIILQR